MAHQPDIWTGDVRRVLYRRLVELFGPSWEWKKKSSPGSGLDSNFQKFCELFAQVVGAKSAGAVRQQIRFALPETQLGSNWGRQAQTAILNKAAALETGFIKDGQLPDIRAVGRR